MRLVVQQFARKPAPGAFSIERVFQDINAAIPGDITVVRNENRHLSTGLIPRLRDAIAARRWRGAVNHVLGDVHYLTFFLPRRRTILTIHDCEMIRRASGIKRALLKFLWLDLPVRRAKHVVAISERTRDDIVALTGIDRARIRVIGNPLSSTFQLTDGALPKEDRPAILHIGTKANKNLERLIEAVTGLPLRLIIVGAPSADQTARLEASGISHETRSNLSDAELVACYAEARALAFVSLSEGFGLPIIEAQAVGRPVLTSDREPMRGVAGAGGALLVDPEDASGIRAGLLRLLHDDALCRDLIEAGRRNVARFDAAFIAGQYAELYREVARE